MPVVTVQLIEGYADSDKRRLCEALTDAVRTVAPAPADAVTVMLSEVSAAGYMRGRQPRTPAPASPDPVGLVKDFLSAMEARDLDAAQAFLGDGFAMVFPGDVRLASLEALVEHSRGRYRSVGKRFEAFDTGFSGDRTIVHCHGTLHGEWLDGAPFDGIRFIDRFEIEGGKLMRQDVWNDLAEMRERAS